ncbi:hypothetical protein AJ85_06550 [Alkalihalobacillus alcalophilus ATCC 27647 = CGMCC 1.3604]|uniref:Uncharacterized protein n=1 Tax=Alkalihalobacillus alcalophilus ATCC 27647 = CGMCC 1.3604 TaxID=1218173 RepID=A0A4S4K2P0_ALKAL|nr:hypothetical protein [Alkalihalobacillus alcalophilus]MED1562446.1 hypothetical protein [Alkalihalobacillus alcalophilus]THG91187.1 hypothetical protein AJ85_06550 [Alkalihalobacillus alcalophilus ATCC 27647 = CGMCC 1.3604]
MKNHETPEEDAKKMKLLTEQLNKEVGNIIRSIQKVKDISQDDLIQKD